MIKTIVDEKAEFQLLVKSLIQSYLPLSNALRTMDSISDRYCFTWVRECLANRYRGVAAVLIACLVCISMSTVAVGVGGEYPQVSMNTEEMGTISEDRTAESNVSPVKEPYTIVVRLDGEPVGSILTVRIKTSYPAQNESEARQADNGTLDLSWFDGDERLDEAFQERNVPEESLEHDRSPVAELIDTDSADEPYGSVVITHRAYWENITTRYSPPVAELATAFRSGDELTVRAPGEAAHHNADSDGYGRGTYTYRWTLDPDDETPEIIFEEGAFESDAHGPLGPAGGIVLSLIALLVAAHLRARNRRK